MIKKAISTAAILTALTLIGCNKTNTSNFEYDTQMTEKSSTRKIESITKENLDQVTSKKYTIIRLTADWCVPCKKYDPFFECLAKEKSGKDVTFAEVDVTEAPNYVMFFKESLRKNLLKLGYEGIAIPTTFFLCEGREVNRYVGFSEILANEIENTIDSLLNKEYDYRKNYTAQKTVEIEKGHKRYRINYSPNRHKIRKNTNYDSVLKRG